MRESCSPPGNRIPGTSSTYQDLNSVQLSNYQIKSSPQLQPGQSGQGSLPDLCSVCGELAPKCDPLTLEENEILEEFILKPFPLTTPTSAGNRFFKKYRICSGCSGKLETLAQWKREIDEIIHCLTTIGRRRINLGKNGQSSSNESCKQNDIPPAGADEDDGLNSVNNQIELEMTDIGSDTDDDEDVIIASSKGQSEGGTDGLQISKNNDNHKLDNQESELRLANAHHIGTHVESTVLNNEQSADGGDGQQTSDPSSNADGVNDVPQEINGRPICPQCGISFSRVHDLIRHQKNIHDNNRPQQRRKGSINGKRQFKSHQPQEDPPQQRTIHDNEDFNLPNSPIPYFIFDQDEDNDVKPVVVNMEFDIMDEGDNQAITSTVNKNMDGNLEDELIEKQSQESSHSFINESEDISSNIYKATARPQRRSFVLAEKRLHSMFQVEGEDDKVENQKPLKISSKRTSKPECDVCGEKCRDPHALVLHKSLHSKNKCDVCLITFKTEVGYRHHLSSTLHSIGEKTRRNDEYGRGVSFGCVECGSSHRAVKALHKHMIDIHGTRVPPPKDKTKNKFRCEHCNRNYADLRGLNEHLVTNKHMQNIGGEAAVAELQKRMNLECRTCHKKFMTSRMLRKHVGGIHRKKMVPERTTDNDAANPKEQVLSDSQAESAGGEALSNTQEKRPDIAVQKPKKIVRFGKPRIRCDPCKQDYASYQQLNLHCLTDKHVQNVGGSDSLLELEKQKRFECHTCQKLFITGYMLRRHIKKVHTKVKMRCEPCNKEYKSSDHLKEHLLSDSHVEIVGGQDALVELQQQKKFRCHICHRKFMTHQMCQRHFTKAHPVKNTSN